MNRSRSGYFYIVLCAVIFSTMEVMLKDRAADRCAPERGLHGRVEGGG